MDINYKEINRASWNARTPLHIASDFYQNESFIEGRNSLNAFELELLPDMKGKTALHLQCHFGQDSISLSRMGAAKVVGVDISDEAIMQAKELATKCNTNTEFICSDVFDTRQHTQETFDLVFASYGTIGWLPDLNKWANVIYQSLKYDGCFVFAEFHPNVWMYDDDMKEVAYKYFKSEPIIELSETTYGSDQNLKEELKYVSWNHGLSEVITALIKAGLTLEVFREHDYSPYDCLANMVEFEKGKYRVEHWQDKMPLVYSLRMRKI